MTDTIDLTPIMALPAVERIRIAHAILDSVVTENSADDLSDEEKAEMLRRVQAHRDGTAKSIPWEEVKAATLARIYK